MSVDSVRRHVITALVAGSTAWAVTYVRAEASPAVADTLAAPTTAHEPGPERGPSSLDRVAAGMVRAATTRTQDHDADEVPLPEPEPRPDPQAAREQELDEHESLLEQSRAEVRDDAWAAPMEEALSGAVVDALADSDASLHAVHCRSTTCEATVRYPDAAAARGHARDLVTGIRSTECTKRLTLTEAADAVPFDATLYFDCDVTP